MGKPGQVLSLTKREMRLVKVQVLEASTSTNKLGSSAKRQSVSTVKVSKLLLTEHLSKVFLAENESNCAAFLSQSVQLFSTNSKILFEHGI